MQRFDGFRLVAGPFGNLIPPMSIEQSDYLVRYLKMPEIQDNELYYRGALQFLGGSFLRRVLGYDVIWDRDFEERLIKAIDWFLESEKKQKRYYFEEIVIAKQTIFDAVKWPRGVKPRVWLKRRDKVYLLPGSKLTARINKLDKPAHVDIETERGRVFTISFTQYQTKKLNGSFRRVNGRQSENLKKNV